MGTIYSLAYQPGPSKHVPPFHYNRVPVNCVTLRAGYGIEGDFKAGRNPERQLNIMSLEHVQSLAQEGWHAGPGELGEQVVISGVDVAALLPGTRLQLGESAVVEINELRTGCGWLAKIQDRHPEDAARRLGVMASVIAGGAVCTGAPVTVLQLDRSEASG